MSRYEAKRNRIFKKYVANLNLLIDNNLLSGIKNIYYCPLCLKSYDFSLRKYIPKKRSKLGHVIMKYEKQHNNIEEISAKTGIPNTRLKNLYYNEIAFTIEEIILIEMSLKLEGGKIFQELYGKS